MTKDLILVTQLPVIEERLKDLSAEIDKKVTDAMALAVTPETLASVKKVRADLNKQYRDLEEQRKEVKRKILEPYEQFDGIYKTYVGVRFSDADAELKRKINDVENQLKSEKNKDLVEYFYELCAEEHLNWLEYKRGNFNVTLSKSRTALHKEAEEFVNRVSNDMTAISVMPDAEEIAVEYKKTLRLGEAVETVKKRREAVEQERREREHLEEMRKAEKEHERQIEEYVMSAPTLLLDKEPDPESELFSLTFTVTDTKERLRLLKTYLDSNGYHYES